MTPRRKPPVTPEPEPEPPQRRHNDDSNQSIEVGGKHLNVKLDLNGRGIVLVYAIAFAIVVGTTGWVVFQIITALKITGGVIPSGVGLILWMLTACLLACFGRCLP
jgi:hypothetical protein